MKGGGGGGRGGAYDSRRALATPRLCSRVYKYYIENVNYFYTIGITTQAKLFYTLLAGFKLISSRFSVPNILDDFYFIFCKLTWGLNGNLH